MATTEKSAEQLFEVERKRFLPLLLANPNYFGNLKDSPLKPVKTIIANSSYEELKCVGFNPQLNTLEGVVWIKQTTGYGGGICTNGSLEYVSFFLSYDNGATWLPQGTTSFPVYDVPGPHPLEYAVSVVIQPDRKFCFENNLPLVRAILSWSTPPAGPTTIPVWGNVVDARIQIEGFQLVVDLPDLLKAADVNLPPAIAGLVSETATVKLQAPKALTAAELKEQYAKTKVPAHRFLHNSIQKAVLNPANLKAMSGYYAGLGIDIGAVFSALENTNGNTDYEQLGCIGLDEGTGSPDALVGTLVIKLPTGYLGNPCTAGSKEYVAFWIDWGSGWQWVGTPSVTVYDISSIPKGGLSYAVYLPVDLNSHRKPCGDGPVTATVRAILSWDTPPPSSDPNYVPVWGNRLETLIFVNPGVPAQVGNFTPYLTGICSPGGLQVSPCNIDQKSGWAYPGTSDSPWGASVVISGEIPGAPLFSWPLPTMLQYQITVQQVDTSTTPPTGLSPAQTVTDPFSVQVTQVISGVATSFTQAQNASLLGYFTYQGLTPDPAGSRFTDGVLAVWNTTGKTGTWLISLTAYDTTTTPWTPYPAKSVTCPLGTVGPGVVIDLDQAAPVTVPPLTITGYMPGGVGPCITAVDCQTFTVGDVICGTYSVYDEHLGGFYLNAEPMPGPTVVSISSASGSGSVVTYTYTVTSGGPLEAGQSITITGLSPSGYNGTALTILNVTSTQFTIAGTTTGSSTGTGTGTTLPPLPSSNFTIAVASPTVSGPVSGNGLAYPNPLLPLSGTISGTWTYNTAGLPPCGYTIELFTYDRTIVGCDGPWENNGDFVGFCLVAPKSGT
jgi:hypothetical protein